jgi:hypothetical protein
LRLSDRINLRLTILLLLFVLILNSCNQIPGSAYKWNPALKKVDGRLLDVLKELPLGKYEDGIEYPKRDKNELVLTNAEELSVFISRQREEGSKDNLAAEALAIYKERNNRINSFVYAALLKSGEPNIVKKKSFSVSMNGILNPKASGVFLTFCSREIKGLLPGSEEYRIYYIHGAAEQPQAFMAAMIGLDYIVLAARKKNLYLEIALPAQHDQILEKEIFDFSDFNTYSPDCDLEFFEASELDINWKNHPVLNRIIMAHNSSGLDIINFDKIINRD